MHEQTVRRTARMAFAACAMLAVAAPAVHAQDVLAVGGTAEDARVRATLLSTRPATEYANLPGHWLVATVELVGVAGLDANALLDWHLVFPDGTETVTFPDPDPDPAGPLADGHLDAGESIDLSLAFLLGDISGPAELVYEPFLDPEPLGRWSVTIEAAPPPSTQPTIPPVTFTPPPTFDVAVAQPGTTSGFEQVRSFDASYDVQTDTTILVTETIEYDFGAGQHHGIFRDLALYQPIDNDHEREYPITDVAVTADVGTPASFEILRVGDVERIKIGDPDIEITGVHTYVIHYRLAGAFNPQTSGPELYFNVTGIWQVSISDITIDVSSPGGAVRVACYAGPNGSNERCTSATVDTTGTATFHQDTLDGGDQLTIVAAFPEGSIDTPVAIVGASPRDWRDAIEPGPLNLGGAIAVGMLGLSAVGALLWRNGRDLVSSGSDVDAVVDPDAAPARRLPLLRGVITPVEFEPPDRARPGLIGTLYDERADPVDVSATIVDLAVRGFIRIEEVPKKGLLRRRDHHLVKLRDDDGTLLAYERILLSGLFAGKVDEVLLSDLKDKFAKTLGKVCESLYAETVRQKWFTRRPDKTRAKWVGIAVGMIVAGGGGMFLAFWRLRATWPAAALVVVGLVFLVAARWMPRRTPRGTSALRRAEGFRRFIVESEHRRAEFAERANLFTEYLPYAIVFGCVDKWAKTFADLATGEVPDQSTWYVGTHPFDSRSFSKSIDSFASAAGTTMSSTPGGSGSSGFSGGSSGGGGGGGGGGSW
jgi:uncharacterized membrane protein YgcG